MWTAGFPEPRTFSKRVLRLLRERAGDFDVVHDNQTLGTALLDVESETGLPAGRHGPPPDQHRPPDRHRGRADPAQEADPAPLVRLRPDPGPGGPALRMVLAPSESSKRDVVREFGVDPERMRVVLLGVDDTFVPPTEPRVRAGSWRWPARTHR